MSKYFFFQRFLRLLIKHSAEHYRTYLMSTAVLVGVMLFGGGFLFVLMPDPPDAGFQNVCFVMLLLLSGTMFTSTIFSDFGEKNKASAVIILPATTLEKFLVGWLYSYVLFILVYTLVFFTALYGLANFRTWGNRAFMISSPGRDVLIAVFTLYSFLHAVALFGAMAFKRLHFIKTAFLFFLAYAVLLLLNYLFLHQLTGAQFVHVDVPFAGLSLMSDGRYYVVENASSATVVVVVSLVVSLLLWASAYYKMKEKQVV
ncbi:hypothetical protein [Mucilaginibacter sp. UR6-11]|uniref:hypothetical protein n=1 Tax=Mucilaginibacter sp. UR6-11 TaxID=1435644 RepID=UPI001E54EA90|nr:hypothetical protein [Mucilaginibacter sp. UR6-11]MCC8425797.1 hypothetical protein [Mucilaginibacter sp. UR6-11]